MDYVLGFAFSPEGRSVVLIEKTKPAWQAGKLNGVGGKIEPGETGLEAMEREFKEETGVLIPAENWRFHGSVEGDDFTVLVYSTFSGDVAFCRTTTEEQVRWVDPNDLPDNVISNIPALLKMITIKSENRGMTPTFTLTY